MILSNDFCGQSLRANATAHALSICFILARPQMGENIGAAARVMKNFAFTDLRIVAPRDGWPNPAAESMAAGGIDVLQGATLYGTVAEAAADCTQLFATTARPRDMQKPVISPHELVQVIRKSACQEPAIADDPFDRSGTERQTIGILFGAERSGLENEEIVLADSIITIPVNPDYSSLNLAQTVAILAYECSKIFAGAIVPFGNNAQREAPALADKAQLKGLFDQLETELDARNFWKVPEKKEIMWLNLRNIFTRSQLGEQEVRTLRGLIRSLCER